jgi:hypothetical protein
VGRTPKGKNGVLYNNGVQTRIRVRDQILRQGVRSVALSNIDRVLVSNEVKSIRALL